MEHKHRKYSLSERFRNVAKSPQDYLSEKKKLNEHYDKIQSHAFQGNGHSVLVLPGFGASDATTYKLRAFLTEIGYDTHGWKCGVNWGPTKKTVNNLVNHIHEIHKNNGGKEITIIGHSLGGILAREFAKDYPHLVNQVITLGSPFGLGHDENYPKPLVKKLFEAIHYKNSIVNDDAVAKQTLIPPPVPTTSIYTRNDHVAYWKASINPKAKNAENIEVNSSHFGLIVNYGSFLIIADRLDRHSKKWKPFKSKNYPYDVFYKKPKHKSFTPKLDRSHHITPHKPIFKL
jgi:esterase/lipase